jgi:hypothetical protein
MTPHPTVYIPVHGTWAIDEDEIAWWKETGPFSQFAKRHNIIQHNYFPFIWSSDLNGAWYNFLSQKLKHSDWIAGGWSLYYYLESVPVHNRNIIAHSHGLQVVLYCAMFGMNINTLISVCSPIRNDMGEIAEMARPKIGKWLHIYDKWDKTQFLGGFGDGRWLKSREATIADENFKVDKINHSEILKKDEKMHLWVQIGWFEYLRS